MTVNLKVQIKGLDDVRKLLAGIKQQAPMILAKTLTQIAKVAKEKQIAEMKAIFNKPNPYVLNSLYVSMATPGNLVASVRLREYGGTPAESFLGPQIFGGRRSLKRFEKALQYKGLLPRGMYAVPGRGLDLDAYGNPKPSQIVQVLSYFQAFQEQGYKANMTAKKIRRMKKGTKRVAGFVYFCLTRQRGKLPPGIYRRQGTAWGSPIVPMWIFVNKSTYKKRFGFHEIGQEVVEKDGVRIANEQIQKELDRLK